MEVYWIVIGCELGVDNVMVSSVGVELLLFLLRVRLVMDIVGSGLLLMIVFMFCVLVMVVFMMLFIFIVKFLLSL